MSNTGGIFCAICKRDPGLDSRSSCLWDGFLDKDTGENICSSCKQIHYERKAKTKHRGLYSEFPVWIPEILNLKKTPL